MAEHIQLEMSPHLVSLGGVRRETEDKGRCTCCDELKKGMGGVFYSRV